MTHPELSNQPSQQTTSHTPHSNRFRWGMVLLVWFLALCFVPDPRPLGAPELAVRSVRYLTGLSEPGSRAVATFVLRGMGLGLLGVFAALFLSAERLRRAAPFVLILAPLLAIASQWINYGYFPVYFQIQLGLVSAVLGALGGLSIRRSRIALSALIFLVVGLFVWGTSTRITDELDIAARVTGLHLLDHVSQIPEGDEGFVTLFYLAFSFAEDNSHRTDPVLPNQAAILALGVILGEERVAQVAGRAIDLSRMEEFRKLRNRITLRGRHDLARHFCVSAALTILSDESRSMKVGIAKELMDATPGGSGFSFVDLAANRAGILFATAATANSDSARATQRKVLAGLTTADYCPEIDGLTEGLTAEQFQTEYGGLGGAKTRQQVEVIQIRLAGCKALRVGQDSR